MPNDRVRILGFDIDNVTMDEAAQRTAEFAASGAFHHVVTVNPEFIMAARRDPAFGAVLQQSDLAAPDGVGLVWAARWKRHPLRQRVAGVDLLSAFAAIAAVEGLRLFLLGAQPGVAEDAGRRLSERNPGLLIAGAYAGSPTVAENDAIVQRIAAARPQALFVAYGAPQQDLWIERNRQALAAAGVGVAMGVGGSFDFITGRSRRAPPWVQRLGMEWLYRLVREPWRWRRMLALPHFVWAVVTESTQEGA